MIYDSSDMCRQQVSVGKIIVFDDNNSRCIFKFFIFFFSSRRRHTRYIGDWSSDVCSSDLVPDSGRAHDIRAIKVVWKREMIRFSQDRIRIITALVQPVLFMFVLGTGLSSLTRGSTGGQIGRASCRERVWTGGEARQLTKQR